MRHKNKVAAALPRMGFLSILILTCLFNFYPTSTQAQPNKLQTYIVYLRRPDNDGFLSQEQLTDDLLDTWYQSFLPDTTMTTENGPSRMVYTYRKVITGFAARLTGDEVLAMEKKDGFISATPQKFMSLHTTHSPSFLGLNQNFGFWKDSNFGKGVIIGVLDTGIAPKHPSFSDVGMPPPPAKWKGMCEFNSSTPCNNKLIGARSFNSGSGTPDTPFDEDGHGTHTASTAAGSFVPGANVYGNANGTAVGVAPLAHVAMYKVCSPLCSNSDILAAMDTAISDGVDILSLSLGGTPDPFYEEVIAVGGFAAIQNGILVSCSAGNAGPSNSTLSNEAPWLLTVGASTMDRALRATAKLGNKEEFDGESVYQPPNFPSKLLPLVYPGINDSLSIANFCYPESFNGTNVKGKIVVCEVGGGMGRVAKGQAVKEAGGAAMILLNRKIDGYSLTADTHVLPTTRVTYAAAQSIRAYVKSTANPTATILFRGTVIGTSFAPMMASFSSRGPSTASPGILKPDITGPGVSVLAAWPFSVENKTNTLSTFNIISGTSMSCPHLSGIAALIKYSHPTWSPAAIKSAIMTTADILQLNKEPIVDETLRPADVLAMGSGHVNPSRANDPGLVYDLKPDDYIPYLCGLNYTGRQITSIVQKPVKCTPESTISEAQLNYPSFSIILGNSVQTYTRTVTNVGEANSVYKAVIVPPPGVLVTVTPMGLDFTAVNQMVNYTVTFKKFSLLPSGLSNQYEQGYLSWVSATRTVRSPISVKLG